MSQIDAIQKALGAINDHLRQIDTDFSIEATVAVPVDLQVGPMHHPTHLDVQIREGEVEIVDREEQLQRIEDEIRTRVEESTPITFLTERSDLSDG